MSKIASRWLIASAIETSLTSDRIFDGTKLSRRTPFLIILPYRFYRSRIFFKLPCRFYRSRVFFVRINLRTEHRRVAFSLGFETSSLWQCFISIAWLSFIPCYYTLSFIPWNTCFTQLPRIFVLRSSSIIRSIW